MQTLQSLQKKLPLLIAIICGILAIVLLNAYLQRRESEMVEKLKEIQKQTKQSKQATTATAGVRPEPLLQKMGIVLVAQKEIPAQTPITPSDIAIKELPMDSIHSASVKSLDEVIGQIAVEPIAAGGQILKTNLLPPVNIGKSLSEVTPPGERAVAVLVDNSSNILSLIRPGNFVDVFALISPKRARDQKPQDPASNKLVSLFQNVKVLAVGTDFGQPPTTKEQTMTSSAGAAKTVILALTQKKVALLSFVQEHGKIKLALRSQKTLRKNSSNQ